MRVWQMDSGAIISRDRESYGECRIEITPQDTRLTNGTDVASGALVNGSKYRVFDNTVTYDGTTYMPGERFTAGATATFTGSGTVEADIWGNGVTEPDWTTDVDTGCLFVFGLPKVAREAPDEAGVVMLQNMTMQGLNEYFGTTGDDVSSGSIAEGVVYKVIGYTSVTYNSVIYTTGERFTGVNAVTTYTVSGTGTVERMVNLTYLHEAYSLAGYDLHVRVSFKHNGGAYKVRGAFIIDPPSWEHEADSNIITERVYEFDCVDMVRQLEQRPIDEQFEDAFQHTAIDYKATNTYITVRDVDGYVTGGRHLLQNLYYDPEDGNDPGWVLTVDDAVGLVMRWMLLVDLFYNSSEYLGLSTDVNEGGGMGNGYFSSLLYYNSANSTGNGAETFQACTLENAYIMTGVYWQFSFDSAAGYRNRHTMWDNTNNTANSLYRSESLLDALSSICVSLALTIRHRVNASGASFIEVVEVDKMDATLSYDADDLIGPLEVKKGIGITGVEVTTPYGLHRKRGAMGSGGQRIQTMLVTANNIAHDERYVSKFLENLDDGAGARIVVATARKDLMSAIWLSTDTPSGTRAGAGGALTLANIYTCCAMEPQAANAFPASDPCNLPPYAEWNTGVTNEVVPAPFQEHVSSESVPAMWLALKMYNDVDNDTDPIGYLRMNGDDIEMMVYGIEANVYYPPLKIQLTYNGSTIDIYVTTVEEDIGNAVTYYKGRTKRGRSV